MVCNCGKKLTYAYIVDDIQDEPIQIIEITDFLQNDELQSKIKNKELFLVCKNNNQLIKYHSNIKISHFKHLTDIQMTSWHKNWQNNFPGLTEKLVGSKHVDILINNQILEIQHSYISKEEINSRNKNAEDNNKTLSWIVDANNTIEYTEYGDIIMIYFYNDIWKYENFIDCEFIYLNIDDRIFKVIPNKIKSNMIDVREFKLQNEFINEIKNNTNIWNDEEVIQCKLYHNQRGAGCGKTYESIQLLNDNDEFKNKDTFIYLTKMTSAKDVILSEFKEQDERGSLENLEEIEINDNNKQYKINYVNKETNKRCKIIIGTIDSFNYALGNKNNKDDKSLFKSLVNSIKDGQIKSNKDGSIRYAQDNIKLNKNCLIIIDEAQDLEPEYIEAICAIMRNTYIDAYTIGDKLQSIWGLNNIHTFLESNELPNITIKRDTGINHVQRFHNENFKNFVNTLIDFNKYGLPPVEKICDRECKYTHENDSIPYNIFEIPTIYSDDSDDTKVDKVIDNIINKMDVEIIKYNYVPKNFMFIFPYLKKNYLALKLETRIQNYWIKKFNDNEYQNNVLNKDNFWKDKLNNNNFYVQLHKSNDGTSIDLKQSENKTRMLSIHASKGTGCEVVFLLGLSEYSLKKFSKEINNLQYDSLIHVAITRQKKSIYVGIENIKDDIYNRFKIFNIEEQDIKANIKNIKTSIKYQDLINYSIDTDHIFKILNHNITIPNNYESFIPDNKENKSIIEWGHHLIRYYVFMYYIMFNINNNEKLDEKDNENNDQFIAKMRKIINLKINLYQHKQYYERLNEISKNNKEKNYFKNIEFPILFFDTLEQSKFYKYKNILSDFIKNIQFKLKIGLNNNKLPELCPLESIILYHVMYIIDDGKYSEISIMDIYTIMDNYNECSKSLTDNHNKYKCICIQKFNENIDNDNNVEIKNSIINHYEKTQQVKLIYENLKNYLYERYNDSSEFTYNISKIVKFKENNNF